MNIWACPVCQLALSLEDKTWRCENNHCFDKAKEGYTNLLLANQKRSADPGDSKAMMLNRRAFLSAGYYQPLAEKLTDILSELLPDSASLLDSGCGEAYYLSQLFQRRPDLKLYGIDISREAVRLASRQLKAAEFSVASSFHLPLLNHSVDAVLRVFAPGDAAEVNRVLKPKGSFVLVSPGPQHLWALKEAIYSDAREHEVPSLPEGFILQDEVRVHYEMTVEGRDAIQQLLAMTPFNWQGDRSAKAALENLDCFTTPVDFMIRHFVAEQV